MTGIVDDILGCTDEILGLRDELGATKSLVYIITRTWEEKIGKGSYTDKVEQIKPTPYLVDLSHSKRLREGGNIKQGDILVKHISKQSYANESDIDCKTSDKRVEKFYRFDGGTYKVISIVSDYVYWNIQVRKTNKGI